MMRAGSRLSLSSRVPSAKLNTAPTVDTADTGQNAGVVGVDSVEVGRVGMSVRDGGRGEKVGLMLVVHSSVYFLASAGSPKIQRSSLTRQSPAAKEGGSVQGQLWNGHGPN